MRILVGELGCVFFSGSWKNAPQFATQNPSKNQIFPQDLEKNAPQFAQNPSKNHNFPHDFEKKKKRTSICNLKSLKNHIFSSLFWKKRTSVYHPKHSCSWLYTKNQPIRDTLEKKSERYPQGKQKMEIYEKNGGNDSLEKVPT